MIYLLFVVSSEHKYNSKKFICKFFLDLLFENPEKHTEKSWEMLIQNKKIGTKGMFYTEQNGKITAKMVYSMPAPGKMIIEHTEVDDSLRGKNIGMQLFYHMVDFARTNNIKVIPLCPFTNAMFKKKTEYSDVLYKN